MHWQKSKVLSLPEKKELWIFSNKHYHNKNERPRSVLKASKFKILSRGKIGKKKLKLVWMNHLFLYSVYPGYIFNPFPVVINTFIFRNSPSLDLFAIVDLFLRVSYFHFDSHRWLSNQWRNN